MSVELFDIEVEPQLGVACRDHRVLQPARAAHTHALAQPCGDARRDAAKVDAAAIAHEDSAKADAAGIALVVASPAAVVPLEWCTFHYLSRIRSTYRKMAT